MQVVRELIKNMYYVGKSDRNLQYFENSIPLDSGMAYNSYIYKGKVNILVDTCDISVFDGFLENVEAVLEGEKLDYIIVNHAEPDHASSLKYIVREYPEVKIICTMMASRILTQFCGSICEDRYITVKENQEIELGENNFKFIMAPNVHWPEVMFTYDTKNKVLFSADAFGGFGSLNGNIVDTDLDLTDKIIDNYRKYYTNIIGKYGVQVISALNKISNLDIEMVCPLHSYILKENIDFLVDKYKKWASYTPEEEGVLIVYGSIYGNTENLCDYLANQLSKKGVRKIKMYDVNKTEDAVLISESFRYSKLIFASVTFNAGLFPPMRNYMELLKEHNLQNRDVYLIQNGSWGIMSGKVMKEVLSSMKDMRVSETILSFKSKANNSIVEDVNKLVNEITS
jgi:flavorubredoxin